MADEFLSEDSVRPSAEAQQECLRVMLIGSPQCVRSAIQELHQRGFSEIHTWSKFQPVDEAGKVLSVMTRRRSH